jgi:opacity protein-like surface antigen
MKKVTFALLISFFALGTVRAQSTAPHAYVGIGLAGADNQTVDSWKAGGKIFAGYEIDQNWGIEAGYTRFGRTAFSSAQFDGTLSGSIKSDGSYAAGKYTAPLSDKVSAYGKLGVSYSERTYNSNYGAQGEHDTGVFAGAGLQYKLTENVSLIGEVERYGKKKTLGAKADIFTVGLKYGF